MATVTIQEQARQRGVVYAIYYRCPVEKKRKYYKSFDNKGNAEFEANNLRSLIDTGSIPSIQRAKEKRFRPLTFSQVGDLLRQEWAKKLDLKKLELQTHQEYCSRLKVVCRDLGKTIVAMITKEDIEQYQMEIAKSRSNVTSNRSLFIIKQIMKHAIEVGALVENPAAAVKYLSEKHQERKDFILPDKVNLLLEKCKETKAMHYLPAIILLAAEHGCAEQEILDLRMKDVMLGVGKTGVIQFFRRKNKVERLQPLMPRTRAALIHWLEHREHARRHRGISVGQDEYVFTRLNGDKLLSFRSAWEHVRELAGLSDFDFHQFRHTFCTMLGFLGATDKDRMELIGHTDAKTNRRYTHIIPLRLINMMNSLAQLYENGLEGDLRELMAGLK